MREEKAAEIILPLFGDWILTKKHHCLKLVIEKNKKTIIISAEDKILNVDKKDIEQYLSAVKAAVGRGRYRLDRNARQHIGGEHYDRNGKKGLLH